MAAQTRKQQLKEIEYQTHMLNNLKKWMRNPFNKYKKEHSKAEMVQNYITENKLG